MVRTRKLIVESYNQYLFLRGTAFVLASIPLAGWLLCYPDPARLASRHPALPFYYMARALYFLRCYASTFLLIPYGVHPLLFAGGAVFMAMVPLVIACRRPGFIHSTAYLLWLALLSFSAPLAYFARTLIVAPPFLSAWWSLSCLSLWAGGAAWGGYLALRHRPPLDSPA